MQQDRPGAFAPENNAAGNVWYWPELAAMTASAFSQPVRSMPLAIDADARPEPPGGLPKGGVTRIALPNRHLEYALTWYGLAAGLDGGLFCLCASIVCGCRRVDLKLRLKVILA